MVAVVASLVFSSGLGYNFAVARYNGNGSLDTTFGPPNGFVRTTFGGDGDYGLGVVIQSDAKIVVAGNANGVFGLARYNTDGSLDNAFGSGGQVTTAFAGPT